MAGVEEPRQTAAVFMGCVHAEHAWRTTGEPTDLELLGQIRASRMQAWDLIARRLATSQQIDLDALPGNE